MNASYAARNGVKKQGKDRKSLALQKEKLERAPTEPLPAGISRSFPPLVTGDGPKTIFCNRIALCSASLLPRTVCYSRVAIAAAATARAVRSSLTYEGVRVVHVVVILMMVVVVVVEETQIKQWWSSIRAVLLYAVSEACQRSLVLI